MKKFKNYIIALLLLSVLASLIVLGINYYVIFSQSGNIMSVDEISAVGDTMYIMVLGCGIRGEEPSDMLEDRLLQGVELYYNGASGKLLMSGDHGRENYDEVNVMKNFALERGIPSEDVFMDHAGFSTYESMYRAKEIFKAEKILIVTQEYHLYRAIYDARALGIEAYGVASDPRAYSGQIYRDVREVLARNKDFLFGIFKPEPTYLGEEIPVYGNGNATNG